MSIYVIADLQSKGKITKKLLTNYKYMVKLILLQEEAINFSP